MEKTKSCYFSGPAAILWWMQDCDDETPWGRLCDKDRNDILLRSVARGKRMVQLSAAASLVVFACVTALGGRVIEKGDRSLVATAAIPGPGEVMLEDLEPGLPREPMTGSTLATLSTPPGAIALQPDGKILIGSTLGGFFVDEASGRIGYYTRGVMRFETNGTLDRSFYCDVGRPGASSAMAARVNVLSNGRIFVSGIFDTVDDKPRQGHARLLPDGRVDASFDPWQGETHISGRVDSSRLSYSSALLSDGSIAVMSRPVDEPGFPHRPWAAYRLDSAGRIMLPELTNSPLDVGRPARLILSYSDIPLGPFPEVPLELIRYAVRLPEGGAVLAVRDRPINGLMRYGSLKRFDRNWQPDPAFTNQFEVQAPSDISLHSQKDGRLLVAGMVGQLNGEDFPGLVRLDKHGAIDRSFRCETENSLAGRVMDVKVQADGRIVICGFFSKVNGVACHHIARLKPDGSLDPTFRPPFVSPADLHRQRPVRVARLSQPAVSLDGIAGTNSAASAPSIPDTVLITSINLVEGVATIRFTGRPGQAYVLQARESMRSPDWANLTNTQTRTDGSGTLRDDAAGQHPMRFYRIARP